MIEVTKVESISVGIDLGTTFSVIAWVDDTGRPQVIRNAEGKKTTPSVALVRDGSVEVGEIAANQAVLDTAHVVRLIKRAMGDREYRFQGMSAIEISAEILRKLKSDAEAELGVSVDEAVITCPAYFDANEVEATKAAGELAGLEVKEIVREPVAAAVFWGVTNLREGEHVLVCDLGGGTYDATVLTLKEGQFKPISTKGNRRLGGDDWTAALTDEVILEFTDVFGENPADDPAIEQHLRDSCEQAKRALSGSSSTTITCGYQGRTETTTVSVDEFESMTWEKLQNMIGKTEDALTAATITDAMDQERSMTWSDVDHILLVGGATRMPQVARALHEASGIEPSTTHDPDTVVALGAAVLGAGQFRPQMTGGLAVADSQANNGLTLAQQQGHSGLVTIDYERTACRSLGTRVIGEEAGERAIVNSEIIPEGSECPAEAARQYSTSAPDAPYFDVPVVEFDQFGADTVIDTWRFTCPPNTPMGTPIEVTFRYVDPSGLVDVDALHVPTGTMLPKDRVAYEEPDLSQSATAGPARHVVFAVDASGSMAGEKIETARAALSDHVARFLEAGAGNSSVGVVTFATSARSACPLTTDAATVTAAINSISTSGTTNMSAGIELASQLLADSPPDVQPEIALVTDGMPDSPDATVMAARRAGEAGLRLSAVSIDKGEIDRVFLRKLTENVFEIEGAEELDEWLGGFLAAGGEPGTVQNSGIAWGETI